MTVVLVFFTAWLSQVVNAWHPQSYATPYYPDYGQLPLNLYEQYAPGYGMYGQLRPRWFLRGHISRYGDYRFDLHVQGLSRYDMYRAWLMYQQLKLYRQLYAQ